MGKIKKIATLLNRDSPFFFEAEITQQYAEMYAHRITPKDYAVKIEINEVDSKE